MINEIFVRRIGKDVEKKVVAYFIALFFHFLSVTDVARVNIT
jgi:hypothetical protein